ncbi:hypothetical protein HNQ40_002932 [Algisphaera agarilytica]|uniref:Uncharacterized protein n=1 Tax=Algisphaera agarilytica TaxID=1385975 RepID=A0A7X0H8C8_9BACT|nr:hypothetical protein [Algisphaera agarilytica]
MTSSTRKTFAELIRVQSNAAAPRLAVKPKREPRYKVVGVCGYGERGSELSLDDFGGDGHTLTEWNRLSDETERLNRRRFGSRYGAKARVK